MQPTAHVADDADARPTVRLELSCRADANVSLRVSVRSKAGIPLASAIVDVRAGDDTFIAGPLSVLAMEGYAHLKPQDRRAVEQRVWSRCDYVTVERA